MRNKNAPQECDGNEEKVELDEYPTIHYPMGIQIPMLVYFSISLSSGVGVCCQYPNTRAGCDKKDFGSENSSKGMLAVGGPSHILLIISHIQST